MRATRGPDGAWAVRADSPTDDAPCASTSRTAAAPGRSPANAPPPGIDPPFSAAAPGVPEWVAENARKFEGVELAVKGQTDDELAASLVDEMVRTGLMVKI